MQSDFEWMRMLWMLLILGSMFAVPIATFWWDDRKARQRVDIPDDQSVNV